MFINIASKAVYLIASICLTIIFILSLNYKTVPDYANFAEKSIIRRQNINLFILIFLIFIIVFIGKKLFSKLKLTKKTTIWLLVICGILEALIAFFWINFNDCPIIADQYDVYRAALDISLDLKLTNPEYFIMFKNQYGMVFLEYLLIAIAPRNGDLILRIVNVLCAGLSVSGLGFLSLYIFEDNRKALIASLLGIFFLPLALYSKYVYGTNFSWCCIIYAFLFLVRYFKEYKYMYGLLNIVLLILAYDAYQASLVAVIACVCVMSAFVIREKEKGRNVYKTIILMLVLILSINFSSSFCENWFYKKTDLNSKEHIPTTAWILMGISSDGVVGPGSFDDTPNRLYIQYDKNSSAIRSAVAEEISNKVGEYLSDPSSLVFFQKKIIYQWTDAYFGSLPMTIYKDQTYDQAFRSFLDKPYLNYIGALLNILLLMVYGLALFNCLLAIFKNEINFAKLLLITYFIGGFLFQLIWEGKSRYCLLYFVILLPIVADSYILFTDKINFVRNKNVNKQF